MLLEEAGEVVLRDEIRRRLWPHDTVVEFDHSINASVQKLREVLGESAGDLKYVETLPRRGYRFLGTVETVADRPKIQQSQTAVPEKCEPAIAVVGPPRDRPVWLLPALAVSAFLGVLALAWWRNPAARTRAELDAFTRARG